MLREGRRKRRTMRVTTRSLLVSSTGLVRVNEFGLRS